MYLPLRLYATRCRRRRRRRRRRHHHHHRFIKKEKYIHMKGQEIIC